MSKELAKTLYEVLTSPNVADSNLEAANLVDTTQRIANGLFAVAESIDRVATAIEDWRIQDMPDKIGIKPLTDVKAL